MSLVPVRLYYYLPNFPWDIAEIVFAFLGELSKSLGQGLCLLNQDNDLQSVPTINNLVALELPRAPITNQFLESLSELRALTLLNVTACSALTDEGIQTFSALVGLQILRMGGGDVPFALKQTGVRSLSSLGVLNTLRFCGDIDEQAVPVLASLTALTSLELNCRRLTDEAVQSISALTLLTSLVLNGCHDITNQGLKSLSALTSLTNLDLAGCRGITGHVGVRSLSVLNSLNTLHLPTRINDDAVVSLSTLTTLTTLRLCGCKSITDQAINSLTTLTSLTTLDLTGCRSPKLVGDWALAPLTALTSISVAGCALEPLAEYRLQRMLPRVCIEGFVVFRTDNSNRST